MLGTARIADARIPADFAPTVRRDAIPSVRARALFDWWASRLAGRAMPLRRDFLAEELAPWWPDLILYDVERADGASRFRFRVHGANAVISDGGNFTGRHLDEVMPAHMSQPIVGCYRAVEQMRLPLYSQGHRPTVQGYNVAFERLIVPFGAGDVEQLLAFLVRRSTLRVDREDDGLGSEHTSYVNDMLLFVAP
jgi:hypothetical protein